jgi:8-oxo-dGTP pyrophosphatase MutT (NUDIX family)
LNTDIEKSRESATVVLLRDGRSGPEVLMLKKNAEINFGGSWVFPGGMVEDQDLQCAQDIFRNQERESVARVTAIRETWEETGLSIDHHALQPFSNWLTPKFRIKRYNALFLVSHLGAELAREKVTIDEQEIVAAQWIRPQDAIAAAQRGQMKLNAPSFVTLCQLEEVPDARAALANLIGDGIDYYQPRGCKIATGVATVYHGDGAYESPELNEAVLKQRTTQQHRLFMHHQAPWEYIDTRC